MKSTLKIILFGFLLWLTVFIASVAIYPVKQSNPTFFETLIAIILSTSTVLFGHVFFKSEKLILGKCIIVGLIWAIINIAFDLPLFLFGPMKRPLIDYMTDIGLTYVVIPIILSAFAYRKS